MGSGVWTASAYKDYATKRGISISEDGTLNIDSNQSHFTNRSLSEDLNPRNIIRECCNTEEHPNTLPIILALDVTGSMGDAAVEIAKKLNLIMTDLLSKYRDIEFCVMGIGDLAYDCAPIQMSQFESDTRIAEHLDKIYFEFGGGGNNYESYTAAWYMGVNHSSLDCWKQGRKGIIITIGDELLNPYLPHKTLSYVTGDKLQADIETSQLYDVAKEKFDIYHIDVAHGFRSRYQDSRIKDFAETIGKSHCFSANLDNISDTIIEIIDSVQQSNSTVNTINQNGEISW